MYARAANAYRKVDLESAPRSQIVERLFERFLLDTSRARDAIVNRDVRAKAAAIDHAVQIVGELTASLDHTVAPELCSNLAALYTYVTGQLTRAHLLSDLVCLEHADRVMGELGNAFGEAHRQQAGNP